MASKGSSALKGAATGAGTGAVVGSVVPGIGTGIGAAAGGVIGGLAGYFGADDDAAPGYTPDAANFQYGGLGYGVDAYGNVVGETAEQRQQAYEANLARINQERTAALAGLDPASPEYAAIEAKYAKQFAASDAYVNSSSPTAADTVAAQRTRGLVGQQQGLSALAEDAYGRAAPTQAMPGAINFERSSGQAYLDNADLESKRAQQDALGGIRSQVAALNTFANQGQGPSAAQAQLQAGTDMAARQQYGMARSQPGGGGSALRGAAFNAAGISGNAANSAATLRASEDAAYKARQLQALEAAQSGAGTVAGAASQARGQDQSLAATQAGQANQDAGAANAFNQGQQQLEFNVGANNLTAAGQARSQNDAMTLGTIGGIQNLNTQIENVGSNALGAGQSYESAKAQGAGINSANFNNANANDRADTQLAMNALSQGAAAYAASKPDSGTTVKTSDERLKKLKRRETAVASALGALDTLGNAPASSYEYKDTSLPGTSPGRHVSSMAQDLERGPRGGEIVQEAPHGKMVDRGAVVDMTPGAITELNRKVKALEQALGGRAA